MPAFENGFLDLPARPGKPRTQGLTHVIDKGLNLREIEGLFDTGGQYVDIVKLGWGTSYVTNNLEKKIALYRSSAAARSSRRSTRAGSWTSSRPGSSSSASRTSRSPTAPSRSRASASSS